MRRALFSLLLLVLAPASVAAHDYWLSPEQFELKPGQALRVELLLGGHFVPEESRPYQPERTESFVLITPEQTIDLRRRSVDGAVPVLERLVPEFEGAGLLAMERDWVDIQLPDTKFTAYLEHEGLRDIAAQRAEQGHREVERECYTRALKSLVRVGQGPLGDLHRRVLGHRLELVLLDNPQALDPGDVLRARVLYRGKPLVGATVTAHRRAASGKGKGKVSTKTVRTDAQGQARITLDEAGHWLLRMVHMEACKGCTHTDWESYWASFSFAVD